ncbi:hypothetical protein EDC04DRAFT_609537 [Pisolithus marmoratus]|nr:hypothetical protein EDC04DRAFT_609537 [Pisolithus marmoratus]
MPVIGTSIYGFGLLTALYHANSTIPCRCFRLRCKRDCSRFVFPIFARICLPPVRAADVQCSWVRVGQYAACRTGNRHWNSLPDLDILRWRTYPVSKCPIPAVLLSQGSDLHLLMPAGIVQSKPSVYLSK